MQRAIEEAKKMILEKKAYRDAICTTGPEEEQLLGEEKVLQQLIERLEKRQQDIEWISVSERLPEEMEEVLVFIPEDNIWSSQQEIVIFYGKHGWSSNIDREPTHWQPQPNPPIMQEIMK